MALGNLIIDQLGIRPRSLVSLVGGGGKSTLMRSLYTDGASRGWKCAAGTTTKVYGQQAVDLVPFLAADQRGDKLLGVGPAEVDHWFASHSPDLLVIEADGSRGRTVKAPAAHEPPVPQASTHVIAVIGADAIDRVIEDVAHRPMLTAAVCGCGPYGRLTPERAARLLTNESRGSRKNVPATAVYSVAITRIGDRQRDAAAALAGMLAERGVASVRLPFE